MWIIVSKSKCPCMGTAMEPSPVVASLYESQQTRSLNSTLMTMYGPMATSVTDVSMMLFTGPKGN